MVLYENAMQVAPVLLIALFLDNRASRGNPVFDAGASPAWARWLQMQNSLIAALNVVTFTLSMFVVAGVLDEGRLLRGIIMATLASSMGLLGSLVQQRVSNPSKPSTSHKES